MKDLYAYPYFDEQFHTSSRIIWDGVADILSQTPGPVIEIGGPTEQGYRFLQQERILSARPLITNVQSYRGVQRTLDGTNMDLRDASVGVFLASSLTIADELKFAPYPPDADIEELLNDCTCDWRIRFILG